MVANVHVLAIFHIHAPISDAANRRQHAERTPSKLPLNTARQDTRAMLSTPEWNTRCERVLLMLTMRSSSSVYTCILCVDILLEMVKAKWGGGGKKGRIVCEF